MNYCGTCGEPAKFFYRDDTAIVYACRMHALPMGGRWKRVDALGGVVLRTQLREAAARRVAR